MDYRRRMEQGIRIYARSMVPVNKKKMDRYDLEDIMARLEDTVSEIMIADYVFGDNCHAIV